MSRAKHGLAFLLSLLLPGSGHFLLGSFRAGLAWAFGVPALALVILFTAPTSPLALFLAALIGLGGRVASAAATSRLVDRRPRWVLVIVGWCGLVAGGLLAEPVAGHYRNHYLQAFTIPSGSMMDTLLVGDYILVDKSVYRAGQPRRGDVVVFAHPADERRTRIHRVIGVPGDTLHLRGDQVLIDGRPLDEPYARRTAAPAPCAYAHGCQPVVVPADSYFVMGDNRGNAQDSRYWGFVGRERILGKAATIYFPWDSDRHWFRWWRVGRRIG
jgi:signal peptidase I